MTWLYLMCLVASLTCLLVVDWRYSLFFFRDTAAAVAVTIVGTLIFVLWDVAGILFGVFRNANSRFASGIELAPHMPLEEPLFLVFLVVCIMICYTGSQRLVARWRQK